MRGTRSIVMTEAPPPISPDEAEAIAYEAYIFGLPLVEHFKIFAISHFPGSPFAREDGDFFHMRNLMTPKTRAVVSPNNDTLFSSVIIDLRAEPALVSIPALDGRYFSLQLIDIETNSFAYAGSRVSGQGAHQFILVGPDYTGSLPSGHRIVHAPSDFVLGVARTGATDRPDVLAAREFQNAIQIQGLSSAFGGEPPSETEPVDWPTYFDVKFDASLRFFDIMSFMLQWHRFQDEQATILERFSSIGVQANTTSALSSLAPEIQSAVERGATRARAWVEAQSQAPGESVNGWVLPQDGIGDFGTRYALRALTAWNFLYVNVVEEAVYLRAYSDVDGELLHGKSCYTLRFPPDALPEAEHFWSLTLYDSKEFFLVPNSIDRYSIGDRTPGLQYDADGGITLLIQHEEPESERRSNWLPAPADGFYLALRLYGPRAIPSNTPGLNRRPSNESSES